MKKNARVISTMAMVTGIIMGFLFMIIYAVLIGFAGGIIGININTIQVIGSAFGRIWYMIIIGILINGLYLIWK